MYLQFRNLKYVDMSFRINKRCSKSYGGQLENLLHVCIVIFYPWMDAAPYSPLFFFTTLLIYL